MFTKTLFLVPSLALVAGVAHAQYTVAPTTYAFQDVSATGTALGLAGLEDGGAIVPIGFDFFFYGTPIAQIAATTNGYLTTGSDLTDFTPDCPAPSQITPNGMIAPFFDDLSCVAHGELYHATLGTAPDRVAIVQWEDSSTFDSSIASLTFQVQLHESGAIEFHYEALSDPSGVFPAGGDTAFVGIEDEDGLVTTSFTCSSGSPFLAAGDALGLTPSSLILSAPAEVLSGDVLQATGFAAPGTFYVFGWSLVPGPIGPFPSLEGLTLDIGLPLTISGMGMVPPSGTIASNALQAAPGLDGVTLFWQAITIAANQPFSGVVKSNVEATLCRDGVRFLGDLPVPGIADVYTMPGSFGEVITVRHCRTDNTGLGVGTLDPYLCVVAPSGLVEIENDDSAGDCLVPGPFGGAQVVDWQLQETGTYEIYAGAFQGTTGADAVGTYELTIIGPGALAATLATDDGPLCPGQPLLSGAKTEALQEEEVRRRR